MVVECGSGTIFARAVGCWYRGMRDGLVEEDELAKPPPPLIAWWWSDPRGMVGVTELVGLGMRLLVRRVTGFGGGGGLGGGAAGGAAVARGCWR